MTDIQAQWRERSAAAAAWLKRSIEACDGKGSAAFYSRWVHPLKGWHWAYPETTGYIIPTLLDYAAYAGDAQYADLAIQQADWVRSLQSADGALPGGAPAPGTQFKPSIFNTGQMILGLVAASDHTRRPEYLESAVRAALWLAKTVDAAKGTWAVHSYIEGFFPAYYTRVCWPMLETWKRDAQPAIASAAERVLDTILGWQLSNGAFRNWEFHPGKPAFTHTISYMISGFIESGVLLGDRGRRFYDAGLRCGEAVLKQLERNGRLAGAYDAQFGGRYWYTCLTGNCQLAIDWMRLAEIEGDKHWWQGAMQSLKFAMGKQRLRANDSGKRGAIAGSHPIWGRYLTLRYPNWATSFLLAAMLKASSLQQRFGAGAP